MNKYTKKSSFWMCWTVEVIVPCMITFFVVMGIIHLFGFIN